MNAVEGYVAGGEGTVWPFLLRGVVEGPRKVVKFEQSCEERAHILQQGAKMVILFLVETSHKWIGGPFWLQLRFCKKIC